MLPSQLYSNVVKLFHFSVIFTTSVELYVTATFALSPLAAETPSVAYARSPAIAPLPTVIIAPASIRAAKLFFVISQNPPFQFLVVLIFVSRMGFPFSVSVLPALPFCALSSAAVRPLSGRGVNKGSPFVTIPGGCFWSAYRLRKRPSFFFWARAQNLNLNRCAADDLYSVPPAFPVVSGTESVSCVLASSICQLFHCASKA